MIDLKFLNKQETQFNVTFENIKQEACVSETIRDCGVDDCKCDCNCNCRCDCDYGDGNCDPNCHCV